MNNTVKETDRGVLDAQREHWQATFSASPEMFGGEPSAAARQAAELFRQEGKQKIFELGSGQGRDAVFFAQEGFGVWAVDYSEPGLAAIRQKAAALGLGPTLRTVCHDVRQPLPFEANSFEACFSHMLFCMALTTAELEFLSSEVRRVLKAGGLAIYTARNTMDPQYRSGTHRGEELYEIDGGFIVHFFSRQKVEHLASGFDLVSLAEFEEGALSKKLFRVCLRKR
jgi:SAM-dependent methyltransferase